VSRTIYNDQSPRWNDTFDFVMVSAGSMLHVSVWDKTSALEMAASLKLTKVRRRRRRLVVAPGAGCRAAGCGLRACAVRPAQRSWTGLARSLDPQLTLPLPQPSTPNPPPHPPTPQSRFQDRLMGRVTIPVSDVVRNGNLKDSFALQDAESGTIEMKLEWANCYVDEYLE